MIRVAAHFFIAGAILPMLPSAFADRPLWWAILGLVLFGSNLAMGAYAASATTGARSGGA